MIDRCFNPGCGQELHYLRDGSVYEWEGGKLSNLPLEFFWLCPECSKYFTVVSDENGAAILCRNSCLESQKASRPSRVRRVLSSMLKAPAVGPEYFASDR
jgi:hypothetical protein